MDSPAGPTVGFAGDHTPLLALLQAIRPHQWSKNVIVFAALVFDRHLLELDSLVPSTIAFISFCLASSATYLLNDIRDAEHDRRHPRKCLRPIASGRLAPRHAAIVATAAGTSALILALAVGVPLALVIVAYLAVTIAYSAGLKHLVIIDVCLIAAGFVLRAVGGAVAISVPVSPWLYVCTALLALFIGFGKRRAELVNTCDNGDWARVSLDDYSIPLLDQLIGVVATATVIAYTLYTFDAATAPDNHAMMLTVPFVVYAIFRYLYLIHQRHTAEEPEYLLFHDLPLFTSIAGWGLSTIVILYAFS